MVARQIQFRSNISLKCSIFVFLLVIREMAACTAGDKMTLPIVGTQLHIFRTSRTEERGRTCQNAGGRRTANLSLHPTPSSETQILRLLCQEPENRPWPVVRSSVALRFQCSIREFNEGWIGELAYDATARHRGNSRL